MTYQLLAKSCANQWSTHSPHEPACALSLWRRRTHVGNMGSLAQGGGTNHSTVVGNGSYDNVPTGCDDIVINVPTGWHIVIRGPTSPLAAAVVGTSCQAAP
eukprot:360870-Chlamydomonas_euryale.AAC.22